MIPPPVVLGLTICEKVIVEENTKNVTLVSTAGLSTPCAARPVGGDLIRPARRDHALPS